MKFKRIIWNGLAGVLMALGLWAVTNADWKEQLDAVTMGEVQQETLAEEAADNLEVHFIDVGQADATLIKYGDTAMLIDTAEESRGSALWMYLKKQEVDSLDYLVLTHPDADHIGGAAVIINKFEIDTLLMPDYQKDNSVYEKLIEAMEYKRLKQTVPKVGETYQLGAAQFAILAPNRSYEDPNNSSLALLLTHGENGFLFTGDAEEEAEADILQNGIEIRADVYKAGHHGSRSSSSAVFLDAVGASYAVISCGEGNDYGHPHSGPLNEFRERGIKVFRTDEQGSIVAVSDGSNITWNCGPSDTWKAGE